jgi:hypothetical protein
MHTTRNSVADERIHRTVDAGKSHADLETHLQMHELTPDAGTSHADLGTHLQMNALTPEPGTPHADLRTCRYRNSPQLQECHMQNWELNYNAGTPPRSRTVTFRSRNSLADT